MALSFAVTASVPEAVSKAGRVFGYLTIGDLATLCGVEDWKVRKLFQRKLLPDPVRVGRWRLIPREQLPEIQEALRKAGYLQDVA